MRTILNILFGLAVAVAVRAEEPVSPFADLLNRSPNFAYKTLGGTQVWTDEFVFRDWRIQRNALTNHCRLLDGRDVRRESGDFNQCFHRFQELQKSIGLKPQDGKAVVLLHGLARSRDCMDDLGRYLENRGDYIPINIGYASTRCTLDEHATGLATVLSRLDGIDEIDLVCHSLGNLVVRRYIALCQADDKDGVILDPRIKRMVMLGPPNQGACLACKLADNTLSDLVAGPCARFLAGDWKENGKLLAVPPFAFGIVAGTKGRNPLVDSENDMFLTVSETKLPGAADFLTLPLLHGELMDDARSRECILRFLREGHFVAADKRAPLVAE